MGLLKGFIDALPNELEEAAYVDGCTTRAPHITFPLMPGVIVSAAFAFISTWNEFILVVGGEKVQTIQIGLHLEQLDGHHLGQMSAGCPYSWSPARFDAADPSPFREWNHVRSEVLCQKIQASNFQRHQARTCPSTFAADVLYHDIGELLYPDGRRQSLRGFQDDYVDIVHYIVKCTTTSGK